MNFIKNLRNVGRSPTQTKPSSMLADSQNNLILIGNSYPDVLPENVVVKPPCVKSRDRDATCQLQVKPVSCDRHAVVRATAPVTEGVKVNVDEMKELEDKLEEAFAKIKEEGAKSCEKDIKLTAMQLKFDALYRHCATLAKELEKKDEIINALSVSEEMAQQLCKKQESLTNSLLAKAKKEKKTKFKNGNHKLHYSSTAPTAPVKHEIVKATARLFQQQCEEQREDVARLAKIVDELEEKYSSDRYTFKSIIITNPVKTEDDSCVTEVFKALCLFSVEVTKEEDKEYDEFLKRQVTPPVIYSPNLPKPTVQWGLINTNIHRNLPKPQPFPFHGAAQDPDFYTEKEHLCDQLKFHSLRPFGYAFGFRTSCGILPVPDEPVKGYMWDEDTTDWVIAAYV